MPYNDYTGCLNEEDEDFEDYASIVDHREWKKATERVLKAELDGLSMILNRDPWNLMTRAMQYCSVRGVSDSVRERMDYLMAANELLGCCIEIAKERK